MARCCRAKVSCSKAQAQLGAVHPPCVAPFVQEPRKEVFGKGRFRRVQRHPQEDRRNTQGYASSSPFGTQKGTAEQGDYFYKSHLLKPLFLVPHFLRIKSEASEGTVGSGADLSTS